MKHGLRSTALLVAAVSLSLAPVSGRAHCDTLDGPVVKTARAALDATDVRPVLAWVKSEHDAEIRAAFSSALKARRSDPGSSDVSDRRFYENVVRVHRAGEGAPYTGLKPDGAGIGDGVRAADLAVENGDVSAVEQVLVEAIHSGLRERFASLNARQPPGNDVAAGRAWVEAYVDYVHYVERLDSLARTTTSQGEAVRQNEHSHAGHAAKASAGDRSASHAHTN